MDTIAWLNSLRSDGNLPQHERERLQALFDSSRRQLHGIGAVIPHVNICRQSCSDSHKLKEIQEMIAATRTMIELYDRLP